jgi:endonuclease G
MLKPALWAGLSGLCLGLSSCDAVLPLWTELLSETTSQPAVVQTDGMFPPCVDDDCNCGDFRDQALAQQVLDGFEGDPFVLDRDGNGLACEALPPVSSGLDAAVPPSDNLHLTLGNPSDAATGNPNNYLIERQQYALAYDRDRGIANWVSWHLDARWLGSTERQNNFRQDGGLPAGFYQVTPNDYRNSGYDRGHIVPSADRTASVRDNSATFLMTNILPQAPENNRGLWRALEEFERDLVYQEDRELFIVAGGYGTKDTLAGGRVTIPARLWKVIVVLDQPGQGVAGVSNDSRIIAIDVPNSNSLSEDWRDYQTSLDRIELATGYDLLSQVPVAIQAVIETNRSQE